MTKLDLSIAIAALALAAGCTKTHDPDDLGTNTNWLHECESSADCDDALACICGVCTQACSEDSECGGVHEATQCAASRGTCGESSPVQACLQGCMRDADCTSVENGRCLAGVCITESFVAPGVADAGGGPDVLTEVDPFKLTLEGDMVSDIPSAYTACTHSNECILVNTTCGCCPVDAIHTDLEDTYQEQLTLACEGVTFPICDCAEHGMYPACREGRCDAFKPLEDCYSPFQNLDLAYVDFARGCDCSEYEGAQICTGREALSCIGYMSDPPQYEWTAVEDGACNPLAYETCTTGVLTPSAEACLDEYLECRAMANGEFCGRNP